MGDQSGTTRDARYRTDRARTHGVGTCIACATSGNAYPYVLGVKGVAGSSHVEHVKGL